MKAKLLKLMVGAVSLLACGMLFSGCEDEDTTSDISATRFHVERALTSYDGTDTYNWDTTLSQAGFTVQIKDFRAGDAAISVYDERGKVLLSAALVTRDYTVYLGDNEFVRTGRTAIGAPGHWTVRLSYNQFSGDQKVTME
jgi:hypothetical protein